MQMQQQTVVGLGEMLWDLLPTGKALGGAPANFAYHAMSLGDRGVPVSRIGDDELSSELENVLQDWHISVEALQIDPVHPTGTVDVEIDSLGQPCYLIVEDVAWDNIEWTDALDRLATGCDAVCFGSLAQRRMPSRRTIQRFLAAVPDQTVRIFDVNIRQHYCSRAILESSLALADVVKLNQAELGKVARVLGIGETATHETAYAMLQAYALDLVCVTLADQGSWLVTAEAIDVHPGGAVDVADAVGAGDAFTAALCHHYLKGSDLPTINRAANELGAWVASQFGATPPPRHGLLADIR